MILFNRLLTLSNFWHYYKKYAVGAIEHCGDWEIIAQKSMKTVEV
jgi:hypothetical protein